MMVDVIVVTTIKGGVVVTVDDGSTAVLVVVAAAVVVSITDEVDATVVETVSVIVDVVSTVKVGVPVALMSVLLGKIVTESVVSDVFWLGLALTNTVVICVVTTVFVTVLESLCKSDMNAFVGSVTALPPNDMLGFRNFSSVFSSSSCKPFSISRCFIAAFSSASWSLLDG